jgi:hypothetical protein
MVDEKEEVIAEGESERNPTGGIGLAIRQRGKHSAQRSFRQVRSQQGGMGSRDRFAFRIDHMERLGGQVLR